MRMTTTKRKMKSKLLLFIFIFCIGSTSAQIVNVENKRKNSSGFQAYIKLAADVKDVGSFVIDLNTLADLQYKKKAHTYIFLNSVKLLKIEGINVQNYGFQHLRYNYTVKDSSFLTIEAFSQYQYNTIKKMRHRVLFGAGPRFRLANSQKATLYIAPLAMYEYEVPVSKGNSISQTVRLDAYLSGYFNFSDKVSLKQIAYFQPLFSDFTDYRLSSETVLRMKFTNNFSFDISFSADYDSSPYTGVQNLFYTYKNALVFSF